MMTHEEARRHAYAFVALTLSEFLSSDAKDFLTAPEVRVELEKIRHVMSLAAAVPPIAPHDYANKCGKPKCFICVDTEPAVARGLATPDAGVEQ